MSASRTCEEVTFKGTGGVTLIAWYLPARAGKPTLLYFTGNAGNVANRAGKIDAIAGGRLRRVHAELSPLWRFGRAADRSEDHCRRAVSPTTVCAR